MARWFDDDNVTGAFDQHIPQGVAAVQPGPEEDADHAGALGADMAHEVRNLMTVVSGSLELLRRQPLDEQGQRQLARAESGTYQATLLTRQVLALARGTGGTAAVVDLNAAVGGFAALMGQQVSQGVQLTAELAPDRLPVCLDAGRLELVLLNLVRNAVDAMPDGGNVVLRTKRPPLQDLGDQLAVEVAVSDDGMGMAPDVARRAVDAFFTTKPHGKGTGLGLWMAHRFASTHDGTMSIETTPGQGTTVRLALLCAGDAA